MEKIEEFKKFIGNYPEASYLVKEGKTTWQKLYELYDIYGESKSVWEEYLNNKETLNVKSILNNIKKNNLDSLEENINSIQKVVGLLSNLTTTTEEEKIESKESNIDKLYSDEYDRKK